MRVMEKEKNKKAYFKRKMHLAIGEIIILEMLFGIAISANLSYVPILYLAGLCVIFIISYVDYRTERRYRKISAEFRKYGKFSFLMVIIFSVEILFAALREMLHLTLWLELLILNIFFPVLLFIIYEPPAAIKLAHNGKKLSGPLGARVEELKNTMGVSDTEVYVLNWDSMKIANAMQIGAKGKHVFISSYLLNNLNEEETLAVLAHEFSHVKNKHVEKSMLLSVVPLWLALNIILLIPPFGFNKDLTLILQVLTIWIPIIFLIILFPLIRRRFEMQADLDAAKYVGKEPMISALNKLSELSLIPKNTSTLWGLSHPSISRRIEKIKETRNNFGK